MPNSIKIDKRLPALDVLRGLAILMVICVHVTQVAPDVPSGIRQLGYFGMFGVQLFFVLSAFSLNVAYPTMFGYVSTGFVRFIIRRYFRIAPLFILGAVLYLALRALFERDQPTGMSILMHMSLLHGFSPAAFEQVVPGGWSIGCEWAFYLVFPLIHRLAITCGGRGLVALAVTSAIAYPLILIAAGISLPARGWSFWVLNAGCQLPCFLFGFIAWTIWSSGKQLDSMKLAMWLGIGLVILGLVKAFCPYGSFATPIICGLAFGSAVLLALKLDVRSRILELFGNLSYSIYIIHFVFTDYLFKSQITSGLCHSWYGSMLLIFACTTIGSMALAWAMHHVIEIPFIRMGKALAQKVSKPVPVAR